MARRRRNRQWGEDILQAIEAGAMARESGPETLRRLKRNPAMQGRALPSLRTVQEIAAAFADPDPGDPWQVAEASADEAALILPILAQRFLESGERTISRGDAKWVVQIRRALPELNASAVSMHARAFHISERLGGESERPILDRQLDLAVAQRMLAEGVDRPEFALLMQADWWLDNRKERRDDTT